MMQEKLQRKVWSPNRSRFRINHQRFKDSEIQRFRDSKIQRFKDSKIQAFGSGNVHGFYLFKNHRTATSWVLWGSGNFDQSWRFPESTVQANCRRPTSVSHQWSQYFLETKQNWCIQEQRAGFQTLQGTNLISSVLFYVFNDLVL